MAFATRLCLLFIAVAAATTLRAPAETGRVSALLARMRTSTGAPYRVHLRSVFHTDEGGVRLVTITDSQNDVFFSRTCVQSLCKGTYFDGSTLYRVDFNRTALPDSQRDAPVARSIHAVESF